MHINNPLIDDENEIFRINTYATKLLCEAAWKKNVRRFVFFSTINVYGVSGFGEIFDEKSEPGPLTAYAESKFVEDIYRYIYSQCKAIEFIRTINIHVSNEESIHQHNAVATIGF